MFQQYVLPRNVHTHTCLAFRVRQQATEIGTAGSWPRLGRAAGRSGCRQNKRVQVRVTASVTWRHGRRCALYTYMSLGVTTDSANPAEHKLVMRTFVFWEAGRLQV